jgi:glycosyltransferase involved in cell wall biosynthesis
LADKSILYIAPAFPVGGAEKFLVLLANSLEKDFKSQTVVSLGSDNKLQNEFISSIKFIALPRSGRFDLEPLKILKKLVRKEKPDIIFCLNFFSFFYTKLALWKTGLNPFVVVSYHSTIHDNKKERILHKMYARLINKHNLVITVSHNQEKYTSEKYQIPSGLFKTIHNGINLTYWHLPPESWNSEQVRKEYGIPINASVIIMTAAFRPEKNHLGAIKSLQLLHSDYHNKAYLLFVGEGPLFEYCRNFVKEQNMEEFIKFTGPIKDVRPYYWSSNLFTLSSTSVETFSLAALEAMACGLAAVLTRIGGADEMIVDGLNGYLCEPNVPQLACTWHKALNADFRAEKVSDYIKNNFGSEKMIAEYRKVLHINNVH